MQNFKIQNITNQDLSAIQTLQRAYTAVYPGAPVIPGEAYLSPGFAEGANVFCAFAEGELQAYAALYPQLLTEGPADLSHRLWIEIKAHPALADLAPVKDALLACLEGRAREIVAGYPGRGAQMLFEYRVNEEAAIQYALAHGFRCTESVFSMARNLAEPLPVLPSPPGVRLCRWKMESEAEQQAYVSTRSLCFPEGPISLAEWQYFRQSPMWASGTSIAAFAGSQLVGNVLVYWDEQENRQSNTLSGYTEYIFVHPEWRKRGIASAMIVEGLRFLKEQGLQAARLAVRALNANALGVYTRLGFQITQESRFYAHALS